MTLWVALLGAYLVGSLDFGRVIPQAQLAVSEGEGSPTWRLQRNGRLMAGLGHVMSGLIAASAGWLAGGGGDPINSAAAYGAGLAAVIGHTFPIFHRFRGSSAFGVGWGTLAFTAPQVAVSAVVGWLSMRAFRGASSPLPAVVGALFAWMAGWISGIDGWSLTWLSAMLGVIAVEAMWGRKRSAAFGAEVR